MSKLLVKRAEEFARLVHRNQSYGELPYTDHLKEVYLTLLDFGVTDEKILAASWLHDSIEDTSTTYEALEIQFGKELADLVLAVTNEKGSNRKEVLEKTAFKIKNNEVALVIKLADRIVNTEFSLENNLKLYKMYEKEFDLFRKLLCNEEDYSLQLDAMWIYLTHLYLEEDFRFTVSQAFEMAEVIEKLPTRSLVAQFKKSPEKYLGTQLGVEVIRIEELDEREAKYYDGCYQIVEEKMYD